MTKRMVVAGCLTAIDPLVALKVLREGPSVETAPVSQRRT